MVSGRIGGPKGHGRATAAVDDSLDLRLSDDRPADQGKRSGEQNDEWSDFDCGAVFHDVSLAEATRDPYRV